MAPIVVSTIRRICLLGLGEVGSRLAGDLTVPGGPGLTAWDRLFPEPDSKPVLALGRHPRLVPAENAAAAASGCELVISAVTAAQDLEAARSVLPGLASGAWFLDVNSVSPATRRAVAESVDTAGGKYVEAAILSPIEPLGIASPMLLGGPHAEEFLRHAGRLGFSGADFCSERIGQAAATKLCRSVVVKGMEALLTEALLAARHYGVEQQVVASLDNLFPLPDWPRTAHYMISRSLQHGARRAEEMSEASLMVREAGTEPLMSEACVQRQQWAARFSRALRHQDLASMLDAIRSASADSHRGTTA